MITTTRFATSRVDFADVFVRAELARWRDGRRSLEHIAAATLAKSAGGKRHHRRAAQRLAARVLTIANEGGQP